MSLKESKTRPGSPLVENSSMVFKVRNDILVAIFYTKYFKL